MITSNKDPYYKQARDVFEAGEKCTFLVGAGISLQPPTCIPSARELIKNLVDTFLPPRVANTVLNIKSMRYEILAEAIQEHADPNLDFLNYFDTFDSPNLIHQFLARAILAGHHVITTNFDYMIERALMQALPPEQHARIKPVITRADFEACQDPLALSKDGLFLLHKIHGSKRNLITGEDTTKSVITTINALGKNKDKGVTFAIEPFKLPAYKRLVSGRTIVVMGYSGRDDFDIGPALRKDLGIKQLIWIDHLQEGAETIFSFEKEKHEWSSVSGLDDLLELVWIESNSEVVKIRANTARLVTETLWPVFLPGTAIPGHGGASTLSSMAQPIPFKTWFDGSGRHVDSAKRFQIASELLSIFAEHDELRALAAESVQSTNQEERARAMGMQATGFMVAGNYDDATRNIQSALQIFETLHLERDVAGMLSLLGQVHERRGDLGEAFTLQNRALEISRKAGYKELEAGVLNWMSIIAQKKGDLDEATRLCEQSIAVDEESGELRSKAIHMVQAGMLARARKDLEKALAIFQDAAKIVEQLGDEVLFCGISTRVVEEFYAKKSPQGWFLSQTLKPIMERLKLYRDLAYLYTLDAKSDQQQGKDHMAKQWYLDAVTWAEKAKDHVTILFAYVNVGHIYWTNKVFDKATEYYKLALAIAVEHHMELEIGIINNFLANTPPKDVPPGKG